ncbi:MAG TPA: hypothetical protein VFY26_03525 [Anaerolineales bacterium]|nr:hypothetical protein [Anaerolineales bacterium]
MAELPTPTPEVFNPLDPSPTPSNSALIFGQTYAAISEEIAWTAISVGVAWLASALIWLVTRPAKA